MASLIKGQILKHLSKFVKNLSPNQINLSALKGEGELTNLELNETVLTELLELPAWIRLTKATCNRASIRIQWTKLKTIPIQLSLDELRVQLETCDELRTSGTGTGMAYSPPMTGQYGFSDKVVDGIMLSINLVHISITSLAFTASFQMSRIVVESATPTWQRASLPMTRLKELDRGEVLIFKELSWQTVRIEAKSTVSEDLTPLRLITNQARCRITIKKRISDCAILGCRLVLILDDLLWVLTDNQLKAALHFVDSISGLVKKATEQVQKQKAVRKLQNQATVDRGSMARNRAPQMSPAAAKTFARYDVVETSYHFYSDRIDLHFCDDPGGGRSSHPDLAQGAAFQVSLSKLQIDYYPYHLARGDRKHWIRYTDSCHRQWMQAGLATFDTRFLDVLLAGKNHTPLARAGVQGRAGGNHARDTAPSQEEGLRDMVVAQLSRLMTTNVIVRLHDISLWRVATSSTPVATRSPPQELCRGDTARFSLPPDLPLVHMEFTQFYYPGDLDFPLPPPALMLYLNPITIWVDTLTLLWINAFTLNLQKSVTGLQASLAMEKSDSFYADVKAELLMPRIIYCAGGRVPSHTEPGSSNKERPVSLEIQASRITASNYRSQDTGNHADLAAILDKFQNSSLFFGAEFPALVGDTTVVCEKLVAHATGQDKVRSLPSLVAANTQELVQAMRRDLLWTEARDVWQVTVDPVWADFHGTASCHDRPVPLLYNTNVTLWIYAKPEETKPIQRSDSIKQKPVQRTDSINQRPSRKLLMDYYTSTADNQEPDTKLADTAQIHVLATTSQLVSLQLDHHQLLFILRLLESVSELTSFLSADTTTILPPSPGETSLVLGAVLPQVDISIILPIEELVATEQVAVTDNLVDSNLLQATSQLMISPNSETPTTPTLEPSPSHAKLSTGEGEGKELIEEFIPEMTLSSDESADVSPKLERIEDKSDPLSTSRPITPINVKSSQQSCVNNDLGEVQFPPKLNLVPTSSIGPSSTISRSQGLTSSFNNMLGGLMSGRNSDSYLSLPGGAKSPEADFDSLSVRSDDSGESEGFVMLGSEERDGMDVLFSVREREPSPELAAEVMEEEPQKIIVCTESPIDNNHEPVEKLVTTLTVHLGRLEAIQQSRATGPSSVLLTVGSIGLTEVAAQSWKHFQHKFSQSGKSWSESTLAPSHQAVRLRMNSTPPDNPASALASLPSDLDISMGERIARVTQADLAVIVQDLPVKLHGSTTAKLADFLQDEIIPTPLPMRVKLTNVAVNLVEDRPPKDGNVPVPDLDLVLKDLTLTRDKAGVFGVESGGEEFGVVESKVEENTEERELQRQLDDAMAEVRILRAKLATSEGVARSRMVEQGVKVKQLEQASSQIDALVAEKTSLMDTLKYLQMELVKSGKKP